MHVSNSLNCFFFFCFFYVTYSPVQSCITQNEEADRLAKVGAQAARKIIKEQEISLATAKAKNKTLSLKILINSFND